MKNRTINRILISIIVVLIVAICILSAAIIRRPHDIDVSETATAVIEEAIIEATSAEEETATAVETTTASEETLRGKTSTRVNIRDDASEDAKVLETVDEGYEFDIIEVRDDGWTCIKYEEGMAYISSLYVILIH